MPGNAPKPKLARRERMARVLEMVEAGASYRAIAKQLSVSHTQVRRDHDDALKEVTLPLAEQVRKLHHARYETLYLLSFTKAKQERDMRAAQVALNALAQQGRMYGVHEPTGADGVGVVKTLLDRLLEAGDDL